MTPIRVAYGTIIIYVITITGSHTLLTMAHSKSVF